METPKSLPQTQPVLLVEDEESTQSTTQEKRKSSYTLPNLKQRAITGYFYDLDLERLYWRSFYRFWIPNIVMYFWFVVIVDSVITISMCVEYPVAASSASQITQYCIIVFQIFLAIVYSLVAMHKKWRMNELFGQIWVYISVLCVVLYLISGYYHEPSTASMARKEFAYLYAVLGVPIGKKKPTANIV